MYTISHPGKTGIPQIDLSEDDEASVDDISFTPHKLAVERIIKKVFQKYGITVQVTDKIRQAFQTKLWCMGWVGGILIIIYTTNAGREGQYGLTHTNLHS